MDLLEEILSGKDPGKRKMDVCHAFLTGKLKDFLSPPKDCRTMMPARELVRNCYYITL